MGATRLDAKGYVFVKTELGWVQQHRLVMERMIGRPLEPGENVHHKNGVRGDNRAENLELWVTMQPTGQRVVDLLAHAQEIMRKYGHLAVAA